MRSSYSIVAALSLLAALLAGCLGAGEERVLGIDATGTVQGLVYFDSNGSRQPEEDDPPAPGVGVGLVVSGTRDTLARASSGANGLFRISRVPVGSYDVVVDSASVPDSVQVVLIDPPDITVSPDDSIAVSIALSFPKLSVADVRALPPGQKVFVEGIALNARETFGDRSVHLAGSSAAIRVTRVKPATILLGDSLRFLGTTAVQNGQPTLDDATTFLISVVEPPPAELVTVALAAAADAGRLDAALVRIDGATIGDTATVANDFVLTVDDGSGALEVILDGDISFTLSLYEPAVIIDVTGLLVPTETGVWALKPRSEADLTVR